MLRPCEDPQRARVALNSVLFWRSHPEHCRDENAKARENAEKRRRHILKASKNPYMPEVEAR